MSTSPWLRRTLVLLVFGVLVSVASVACDLFKGDGTAQNQPPTVTIVSPEAGAVLGAGVQLTFEGTGQDAEDGQLTGNALSWSSSVDGSLGTGGVIQVQLTAGDHEITLTGTDSDGATATASVQVTVEVVEAVERDDFPESEGWFTLQAPDGSTYKVYLSGSTSVEVFFEGPEGDAVDDDDDGLDEVRTEVVALDFTGQSPLGPVGLTLNDDRTSEGQIEERENATEGRLDLPPFANEGEADSFFDVFFEVTIPGGVVLHNEEPKRLEAVITHKPPARSEAYQGPDPVPLFDDAGAETGWMLESAAHVPDPPPTTVEQDVFQNSRSVFSLNMPDGSTQQVEATGATTVEVFFKGDEEGRTLDTDSDGLDDVATEIVELSLTGSTPLGDVQVRLNPERSSLGQIEERENMAEGRLDLPPFSEQGSADSFFDVFFELELPGGTVLRNEQAKRFQTSISHKPPAQGEAYQSSDVTPLVDPSGAETGYSLGSATQVPNPPPTALEIDDFPESLGTFTLGMPDGSTQEIRLEGPTTVHVRFDGEAEGSAQDDDDDGRDEVETELVQLDLSDVTPAGPVSVGLNPDRSSTGEIEETQNGTPGTLDLSPFTESGTADSFFDVFFEIEVPGGMVLHNEEPKRLSTVITHKPPAEGEAYEAPEVIPLLDPSGAPTGYTLGSAVHVPDPPPETVEHDLFEESEGSFTLGMPDGSSQEVTLTGPTAVDVFFEGGREGDADDDDGDGRDEVRTEMVSLELTGSTPMGPVSVSLNPNRATVGEIEESQDHTPGTLDLQPFTAEGSADSFFDVFFELEIPDGTSLFNPEPKRLETIITFKPPAAGETYEAPEVIELVDASGNPTGYTLGPAQHVPDPPVVETDHFPASRAGIDLRSPEGLTRVSFDGPATAIVLFEGDQEGDARDDDDDGLDEVRTELVSLDLTGSSPMGEIEVRLSSSQRTMGEIEEQENLTPGVLDVPPFTESGTADSFFDVFFEIELEDGTVMENQEPKHLETVITNKPPAQGDNYFSPDFIPLFLPDGSGTGYSIGGASHVPAPLVGMDPVFISFQHFVGQSRCPQSIGAFTVSNRSDQSLSGSVSTPGAVDASQTSLELAPGGSQEVSLRFNCQTTSSFEDHVVVDVSTTEGPSRSGRARVLVVGSIR